MTQQRGQRTTALWPFQRLARTHALMAIGDAAMYGALAGSVLLGLAPDAQRPRVLLYLLVSAAPFAVVAPLIGPVVDRVRGGRRMVVQLTALVRVVLYALMALHADDLWLYPLVFATLVMQKTYAVSKSALVPAVVRNETELVEANSKLGLVSAVVGAVAVAPCAALGRLSVVPPLCIGIAALVGAGWQARYLPRDVVAARRADAPERALLRARGVRRAAVAMVLVRASIGFLTFHLFFWLRDDYGLVAFGSTAAAGTLGSVMGNVVAPRLRRGTREEVMLVVSLATLAVAGVLAALVGGFTVALLLAAAVNFAGSVGRMAFDSIVQREAPTANQSRAFAKFETRFQLAWVLAATPPVAFTLPGRAGFAVVAALGAAALVLHWLSGRGVRARGGRSRARARPTRPASAAQRRGPAER
ncbi:MAG: hypothetical protein RLZ14_2174 [Actinomycetota bacterium]